MVIRNKGRRTFIRLAVIIFVASIGLTVFFITLLVREDDHSFSPKKDNVSEESSANNAIQVDNDYYDVPVRLVIPKIDVDTEIKQMGLTASGHMEAPRTNDETGWYKHGPRPGNMGSAVIAGHLGVNHRAVFARLDQLLRGDTISVTDNRGQAAIFIVRETRTYDNDATPNEVFTSEAGAHLNLITCNGSWEASSATYSQRLVVFTDRLD
jgi:LPXTG-site transpeptidase (sortase) family protein